MTCPGCWDGESGRPAGCHWPPPTPCRRSVRPAGNLDGEQRRTNLRGAYGVQRAQLVEGKAVLLVDDVTTTGSTLAEAARALRQAGARYVGAVTLATA